MRNAPHIVQGHSIALAHRAGVEDESVNKDITATMHVAPFVSTRRTGHPTAKNTHILCILDGKGACEVAASCQINSRVGGYMNGVLAIEARFVGNELASLFACLLLCILLSDGRFGGK